MANSFKYYNRAEQNKFIQLDINVDKKHTTITIKDNGIGLPDSHLNDIFGSDEGTDVHSMTLGLHNVKKAVRILDGEISFDSQLGMGSTFTIVLPNK